MSQVVGAVKGLALGAVSGGALYFGLNHHLWGAVNEAKDVLARGERLLTGDESAKYSSSISNPFPEPAAAALDEGSARVEQAYDQFATKWNSVIQSSARFVLSGEASTQVETALEEFIRQQRESTAAKAATPSAAQETGTDTKTEVVVMTTAGSAEK